MSCLLCVSCSVGLPTIGDLTRWENVGKPTVVADLLKQRRDSDAAGGTQVESVVLPGATIDGDVLQVSNRSRVEILLSPLESWRMVPNMVVSEE